MHYLPSKNSVCSVYIEQWEDYKKLSAEGIKLSYQQDLTFEEFIAQNYRNNEQSVPAGVRDSTPMVCEDSHSHVMWYWGLEGEYSTDLVEEKSCR
ncbi:hypothetical protein NC652_000690 [Populus alba x Populus x berolinensis]|nr:hypothetical protein NC652_000690 [Populus alba x Populus x berolinensis]